MTWRDVPVTHSGEGDDDEPVRVKDVDVRSQLFEMVHKTNPGKRRENECNFCEEVDTFSGQELVLTRCI